MMREFWEKEEGVNDEGVMGGGGGRGMYVK